MARSTIVDDIYKIVVVGNQGVGKSTFINQYVDLDENRAKNHLSDMDTKIEKLGRNRVEVQVWDLTGNKQFRNLVPIHTKHASGGIILFDITNYDSFKSIERWVNEIRSKSPNCEIAIVGNKTDLKGKTHKVDVDAMKEHASQLKAAFHEVSSFDKKEVELVFKSLVQRISEAHPLPTSYQGVLILFSILLAAFLYFFLNYYLV